MDVTLLILLVVGALCFLAAALIGWSNPSPPRLGWANLIALGLLAWLMVDLILRARAME